MSDGVFYSGFRNEETVTSVAVVMDIAMSAMNTIIFSKRIGVKPILRRWIVRSIDGECYRHLCRPNKSFVKRDAKMKKRLYFCMVMAMLLAILAGCSSASATTKTEEMSQEVAEPEVVEEVPADGSAKYIVTFRIKQSHFTLDIGEHIKDSMNEITFEVPVDKEYYDSVSVGSVINDDFRMGSLIMHGSFGKWKVTIDQKEIR